MCSCISSQFPTRPTQIGRKDVHSSPNEISGEVKDITMMIFCFLASPSSSSAIPLV